MLLESLLVGALVAVAPPIPTPAETRRELEAICRALRESDDAFFGERIVDELEARLIDGRPKSQEVEAGIRGRLGWELRRIGRTEEAVRRLEEAREIAAEYALSPALRDQIERDLGLTWMVFGERSNCVGQHRPASCILPFLPAALHTVPEGARKAGDHFLAYLEHHPDDIQVIWLVNLARRLSGDGPEKIPERFRLPESTFAPEVEMERWPDRAPALGVAGMDLAGGAILDDFDGDGLLDLVSSSSHPCQPLRAYRNDGEGGFDDVTVRWGLDGQLGGLNMVHADYDNDGQLDLLVLRGGWWGAHGRIRNSLLRNDLARSGQFEDRTVFAGLAEPAFPTQTAGWADYDGDGDLDLFVANEAAPDRLYPSQLFRNRGDGTFEDVAAAAGVANLEHAKATVWGDVDGDGDPDLFVSNIGPNRLYLNRGDGTFEEAAARLGVVGAERPRTFASWFFDVDQDGDLDLLNADYGARMVEISASYMGLGDAPGAPHLYLNELATSGRFREAGPEWGLSRPALPMGANFGDLDNDGWLDMVLSTGVPDYEALAPDLVLRNEGGKRFREITFASGLGHLQKGHGVAFGDVDNDGDQDLFHQVGGQYPGDGYANALFENPSPPGSWVTLRFEGRRANRCGIGAEVELRVAGPSGERTLYRTVGSGGSFGGSSLQLEIGLGDAEKILRLRVRWPGSGTVQEHTGVALRRFYRVVEGATELEEIVLPRLQLAGGAPTR